MKVSILIPVYNSEKFLARTIQSALDQTWPDVEIIIVDDGSVDNSFRIAKSFEVFKNVKVFTQPNGGGCKARNKAFAESTGDYIQYLDADDLLSPDKIKNQIELTGSVSDGTVFSCPWIRFYNDDEMKADKLPQRFLDRDWSDPVDWLIHSWQGKGMGQTSVWLTPRHLIRKAGAWDERLSINQDGEFFSRVLLHASSIKFTNQSLVYYRSGNEGSVSQNGNMKKVSDLLLSYKLYEKNIEAYMDNEIVRNAIACNYLSFIYLFYGKYPDLVSETMDKVSDLKLKKNPEVGGDTFKRIARIFGFQFTLKLMSLARRLGRA